MQRTKPKRKYELKLRAERQAETRRRITEATIELHEEVGPAATRISEIARRAGVQRLTVYNHFPDDRALFDACSSHWLADHPFPDPAAWKTEADPDTRTRTALEAVYDYYERNQQMMGHILRDAETVAAIAEIVEGGFNAYLTEVTELLVAGWRARGARRARLEAMLGLALRFHSWRHLVQAGLASDQGAALMAEGVRCAASVGAGRRAVQKL